MASIAEKTDRYIEELIQKSLKRGKFLDPQPPDWVKKLILVEPIGKPAEGGSKKVYLYNDMAIALSRQKYYEEKYTPLLLRQIFEDGKQINKKEQKLIKNHLVYPTDRVDRWGFIFLRMEGCYYQDLSHIFKSSGPTNLVEGHFLQLMQTLTILHKNDIFLGDIKPENIMLCRNNQLAFVDTDDIINIRDPNNIIKIKNRTNKVYNIMYKGNFDQTVFDSFLTLTRNYGKQYATTGTDSGGWNITTTGYLKRDIELNDWNALALCILYDFDAKNWRGKESGAYRARDVEQKLFHSPIHDAFEGYNTIKIQKAMNILQMCACKLVQGVAKYIYPTRGLSQDAYAKYVRSALINFKELINKRKIVIPKLKVRKVVEEETYRNGITSAFPINVVKRYQLKF